MRNWWQAHRPTTRRLAQLYCALLYNANLRGFGEGRIYTGPVKALCVPGLNCYSCPGAAGACPLGALQNAVSASGRKAPAYILGILLLFGLLLGRTVCGFLCPFGLVQELLHKIPTPKLRKSRVTRALSWLKYAVLAVFVLILPLWLGVREGLPVPAFCKYICLAGTFEGAGGLLAHPGNGDLFSMLGALFTRKYVILLLIGLSCVFCYRLFCRFLCPLGAIYGFFSRIALVGITVDADKCTRCGRCVRHCRMDVRRAGDHECIHCGECMDVCAAGAISLKAGKITLKGPDLPAGRTDAAGARKRRRRGRIAWGAALAALVCALVLVNFVFPGRQAQTEAPQAQESGAPVGYAAGERLADFTVTALDGRVFSLSEQRGRPVIINLWATYCVPCVQEMPLFCRLGREHPEISILAVHSSLVLDGVDLPAYIAEQGWTLDFAVDDEADTVFQTVGSTQILPQTIVLNARGEVIYNEFGSMTWEKLEALAAQAEAEE